MSKTSQLIELVKAGTHMIRGATVYRKTLSGEWVRSAIWRKDVIFRAAVATM